MYIYKHIYVWIYIHMYYYIYIYIHFYMNILHKHICTLIIIMVMSIHYRRIFMITSSKMDLILKYFPDAITEAQL